MGSGSSSLTGISFRGEDRDCVDEDLKETERQSKNVESGFQVHTVNVLWAAPWVAG